MIHRYLYLPFFLLLFGFTEIKSQEQDYLWPTDASQRLTSTFGETRSAHYHSGLDIKTWGKEGYRVFASKDGIVHRLAISEKGYGKAIYLKHKDGSFTVYAHLQRFRDDFQAYVDSIRLLDYSFEIDLEVEDLNLKVSQGDVIGFTGSTGVGPPHLHFETREANETTFNSLLTNLSVEDSLPPTLSALLVFPLSDSTQIRNSKYPQLFYPSKNSTERIQFEPIKTNGPIGLSISTYDEANGVTNKYAVYELGLIHQNDTLFYEKMDRFSFQEDDLMLTDRLTSFGATRRSYQTLFKKDGPENPFYKIADPRTNINPEDSIARFELFVIDYFGNKTAAEIVIDGGNSLINKYSESSQKPIYDWYWTENWAFTGNKTLTFEKPTFGHFWKKERSERIVSISEIPFLFSRINPLKAHSFQSPDERLKVRFSENTFFDTLTVASSHSIFQEFPFISLHSRMLPVRKEFEIQFYLGDTFIEGEKYRLFRYDRIRDRITYIDSKLIGKTIHGYPSDLGEFLVIPDNDPPQIEPPSLFKTDFGKWFITLKTFDQLTEIDFTRTRIFANGVQGIVEYDNEESLLIYYHPQFSPKNKNTVTISVFDKAGNQTNQSFQL